MRLIPVAIAFACLSAAAALADGVSTVQIVTAGGMTVAQGDDIVSRALQTQFAFEWARSADGSVTVSLPGYIMVAPDRGRMRLDGREAEQLRTGTLPSHDTVSVSAGRVNAGGPTRLTSSTSTRAQALTLIVAQYN